MEVRGQRSEVRGRRSDGIITLTGYSSIQYPVSSIQCPVSRIPYPASSINSYLIEAVDYFLIKSRNALPGAGMKTVFLLKCTLVAINK
jgi:hypothetical protein